MKAYRNQEGWGAIKDYCKKNGTIVEKSNEKTCEDWLNVTSQKLNDIQTRAGYPFNIKPQKENAPHGAIITCDHCKYCRPDTSDMHRGEILCDFDFQTIQLRNKCCIQFVEGNADTPHNTPADKVAREYQLTDCGNAERLRDAHPDEIKHCYATGTWHVWDGAYWTTDDGDKMVQYAKEITKDMIRASADLVNKGEQKDLLKFALATQSSGRIKAMIEMCRSEVPVKIDMLDTHKYLFNTTNYTLDLNPTNEHVYARAHTKSDLITKMANVKYDPEAKCPKWLEFLSLVFDGNQNVVNFAKRFFGTCLTGDCGDQVFAILYGSGNNGKTTMMNVLRGIMSVYTDSVPAESLMVSNNTDDKKNAFADLPGVRMVTVAEGNETGRLNEALVKYMTGNEIIKCRKLFHEFFEYTPQFKPVFYTNHQPDIRGVDHAIWRRIMLIPFNVNIVERLKEQGKPRIPNYEDVLIREEASGILNWLIEGWYEKIKKGGLCPPSEVQAAVDEYKKDQDVVQRWIDDECDVKKGYASYFAALYNRYDKWAEDNGEPKMSRKEFGKNLTEKGFSGENGDKNKAIRIGIKLIASENISVPTKLQI